MKRIKMREISVLTFLLTLSSFLFAQKYSNEFLSIGVGAKGIAMGNSLVASSDEVTSSHYNPAGLARIKDDMQTTFMHSEWFAGISKYDYFSVGGPLKTAEDKVKRALGFSFVRFGIDNIPNTLSLYEDDGSINFDNVVPFSAADYGFIFSYAQGVNDKLDVGGNVKIVHRKVGPFATAWGFGLDLGGQYHVSDNFTLGLMLKDVTSTFNAWSFKLKDEEKEVLALTNNEIPINSLEITKPQIILGMAYGKNFPLGKRRKSNETKVAERRTFGLLGELDFQVTTDGKRNTLVRSNPISMNPSAGLEIDYNKLIFLRGGLSNFQKSSDPLGKEFWAMQPSAGIGVNLWKVRLDYTFTNLGDQQEKLYSHVFSMLINVDFAFFKEQIKNAN